MGEFVPPCIVKWLWKTLRRPFRITSRYTVGNLNDRFSPGTRGFLLERRDGHLPGRVVRLLRHGARRAGERALCLELGQPSPGLPARRRAAEEETVVYTTLASSSPARSDDTLFVHPKL